MQGRYVRWPETKSNVRTSVALVGLNRSVHSALGVASATAAGLTSTSETSALSVSLADTELTAGCSLHIRRRPRSAEVAAAAAKSAWLVGFGVCRGCNQPGNSFDSETLFMLCIRKAEHQSLAAPPATKWAACTKESAGCQHLESSCSGCVAPHICNNRVKASGYLERATFCLTSACHSRGCFTLEPRSIPQ